jgi:hypothetical protein
LPSLWLLDRPVKPGDDKVKFGLTVGQVWSGWMTDWIARCRQLLIFFAKAANIASGFEPATAFLN